MRSKIALILIISLSIVIAQDWYAMMELKPGSSETDVRRAYVKLTKKYNPDKNVGDAQIHRKFVEVTKAYEVLGNSHKQQVYDHYGNAGLEQEKLQGNRRGGKGPNSRADIKVTLEELYTGTVKEYNINQNVICSNCRGTGSQDGKLKQCPHCQGQGVRLQRVSMGAGMNFQMQVECDHCGGRGVFSELNCQSCRGRQVLPENKNMKINIDKGMQDGQEITFRGEGEQNPEWNAGDLFFTIKLIPHSIFKRYGNNLYTDVQVSFKQAIFGFQREIRHLDGHFVQVNSGSVTADQIITFYNDGMPLTNAPSRKGALHVKVNVNMPTSLSDSDRQILKQIFDITRQNN